MMANNDATVRSALLVEHENLLSRICKWRSATRTYRWFNVTLFMMCKLIVPTGALIIAIDMVAIVVSEPFLPPTASAVIAIVVTFLASLEAMLNPGAKKRLAFTLNNELTSIEYRLRVAAISENNGELSETMARTEGELKKLLNHYSENGY
jgi:hypothetical protein